MPNTPHQPDMQDLLDVLTSMILDADPAAAHHTAQDTQADNPAAAFIALICRLQQALVEVEPSRRFTRRLKQDLIAADNTTVLARVRSLPPRVQIAAGIALVAGFMLLSRRRVNQDVPQQSQETARI